MGSNAVGWSVMSIKWQKSLGSSRVFKKAFWAASFMASAGRIMKKRSEVSQLLVRAMSSRTCSTVMVWLFVSVLGSSISACLSSTFTSLGRTKIAHSVRVAISGICLGLSINMDLY